jgi:ABC-type nitrate/sulfonate/bicarbonate transport system substrate-binding protein
LLVPDFKSTYGKQEVEHMNARVGCIFLLLLSLPGAASAQAKPEKEKIRIGYAARVVAHSIPYLAAQAGLFREEGLQL